MMMAMTWAITSQLAGQGGLLFKAHNGGPLHAAIIQGELDVIAKEAGIPRLRCHCVTPRPRFLAHAVEALERMPLGPIESPRAYPH